jgi:hypothetical protein
VRTKVRSSGSGAGADWHLAGINVEGASGPARSFPCNAWLGASQGLERLLLPDVDGDGIGDEVAGAPLVAYTLAVFTSDIRWGWCWWSDMRWGWCRWCQ